MITPANTQIRCASCGQPFSVAVRTLIDVQRDPQGKALLMAGHLNTFDCPHCGFENRVVTPLLYHDAEKSLLIAFIPMEISLQTGKSEEKIVGDMLNELTRSLPKDQFRAYMFNPKRALTLEGLREQVMEADGITKEMMEAQRRRVELMQSLLATNSEEALKEAIEAADSQIDEAFFRLISVMYQRLASEGQTQIAASLEMLQERLLLHSTAGKRAMAAYNEQQKLVEGVMADVQALGEQATRDDLQRLALGYGEDTERLQALVGLARPAMDYQFFNEFTQAISQAPAKDRPAMEAVRDQLLTLTQAMDAEQREAVEDVLQFLTALINSPDPDALIDQARDMIDAQMLSILAANIQEAQRQGAAQAVAAMERIYDKLAAVLEERMPPEVRLLNRWINAAPEEEPTLLDEANQFDRASLLEWCDAMLKQVQQANATEIVQRLQAIRAQLSG